MRITLEMYDDKYIYESNVDGYSANKIKEIFSRMLVQATFPPDVIELADGGCYKTEYVEAK